MTSRLKASLSFVLLIAFTFFCQAAKETVLSIDKYFPNRLIGVRFQILVLRKDFDKELQSQNLVNTLIENSKQR